MNNQPESDIHHTSYPLVSIALCVYNGEKYLGEQLDSLVNQTYPNIEIVVLDDGSKDRSRELLRTYAEQYPIFRIFENEVNLGYVKNFEKAISLCEGEYIALCDQDDIWDLEKISKQVAGIGDNLLIYHDSAFMDEQGRQMTWKRKMSDIIHLYRGNDPKVFLYFNCVSGHSILFKRDLRDDFLPFNPDHFHDHWIAYVAANLGSIEVIPETLVRYRQHTTASTDILNKRKKIRKNYHENRDIKKLKKDLKWVQQCAMFDKNRDQSFLDRLRSLFEERLESFFSFEYAGIIRDNYELLYYIPVYKKSSKLSFVYRQIWGLRAKLLWARFFARPETEEYVDEASKGNEKP
ncbi:Glycosyltransferase involved in cell wall bisynthesis [Dyadobacter sp. SG02]|uniref:glycosyltransferase family 2 protein n=1 Tax=Dyadobacter sp. SG02 TaxID=1855291 RepID=UPI0008C1BE2B|nr:glycosyltransferase family 2 protein [Dyadobacter sp. SG02]SEJ20608.1 Glycosyltransferase involved in cell wall bisynthesis [Dyadobacter sp. SG02]